MCLYRAALHRCAALRAAPRRDMGWRHGCAAVRGTHQWYDAGCDVWGVGMSVLALALGRFPLSTDGGYWGLLLAIREEPVGFFRLLGWVVGHMVEWLGAG